MAHISWGFQKIKQFIEARSAVRRTLSIFYWLPIGIVFTHHFYTVKVVTGKSMQPTLNPDSDYGRDVVVFDRFSVKTLRKYERGDIVALWSPLNPATLLVKRIIALEGDVVQTLPPYPDQKVHIPKGHIWVEGDEPFRSSDSNRFGPIPVALVDSKLTFIIWPLQRFGSLNRISSSLARKDVRYGPAWRRAMAEIEREKWRKSRITVPSDSTTGSGITNT